MQNALTSRPARPRSLQKRQEAIAGWLMAAPVIVLLTVFVIAPFFFAIYFSFTNQRLISPNPTEFVGLRNYQRMLNMRFFSLDPVSDATGNPVLNEEGNYSYPRLRTFTRDNPDYPQLDGLREYTSWQVGKKRLYLLVNDVVFIKALFNTIFFVLVVAPLQGGLALLLALLINQRLPGINIFRTIYFMPVVISMVVIAMLWRFIYDGNNGLLNSLLSFISIGRFEPQDWLGNPSLAMGALIAMSVWQAVGFHMIIWLAGLQTIPGVLYEAASTEGANGWQKFRHVTWPGLRNTAVFILIIITMQAFGLFIQVDVMTSGGPLDSTQSLVYQAYVRGFQKQDIAGGSAISVLLFLIVISISIFQAYVTRERRTR
ncbi:MAG: sugar ABC transporter permease [Trueperaceae bacterium]|nr:sugar ABC transporter permease [Trueperaceae bacterium]